MGGFYHYSPTQPTCTNFVRITVLQFSYTLPNLQFLLGIRAFSWELIVGFNEDFEFLKLFQALLISFFINACLLYF